MKSGALVKLYKQKGSREECSAHRGILLLSTLSKALHQSMRPALAAHHELHVGPMHLSSRRGMSSLFGAHCVRLFLAHRWRCKQPAAVLFADIESAYYATIRGMAMRKPGTTSCSTADSATPGPMLQEVRDLLSDTTALTAEGLDPWAEAIAAELHSTTWMTILWGPHRPSDGKGHTTRIGLCRSGFLPQLSGASCGTVTRNVLVTLPAHLRRKWHSTAS